MIKVLFAGGGTGGHIFPGIAIADALRKIEPNCDIVFIGTKGKIESRVVPKAGYKFKSIWISGFRRSFDLKNLLFPLKLVVSLVQSFLIIKKFKPDVVVGTGGYVSGPPVFIASLLGIPTLIQEQNSFPGITTRLLSRMVDEVHISFDITRKYLKRKDNVFLSGNPVRSSLKIYSKIEALKFFGFNENKKTIFVFGGSTGARSINEAMLGIIDELVGRNIQVIWQTGEFDFEKVKDKCKHKTEVRIFKFIDEINYAYSACDLAICRAGATTISEITYFGVPSILVPYPFATVNHQYENAKFLAENEACEILLDSELKSKLKEKIFKLIYDDEKLRLMREKLKSLANPEAGEIIAKSILKLAKKGNV
ncbi:MAG: undecaprenyldiphospho-muramoylpentapeptide beta-N-acetylglucosaminyltransferase [Candidatus Kryptonium sp.]|nr:undecaprenyldiphospho-muramoylpentapeptide beta-N-acetylglucosaminyltransferase [Candidatus Kryptonium sp.]